MLKYKASKKKYVEEESVEREKTYMNTNDEEKIGEIPETTNSI